MIALWMLYTVVIAAVLALAASLLESGFARLGIPVRWVWVAAMLGSIAVPAVGLFTPAPTAPATAIETASVSALDRVSPLTPLTAKGFVAVQALDPINRPLVVIWLSLSALIMATLAWTSWRTKRQAAAWQPSRVAGIDVMYSTESGPAVVGWFPGRIVLPRWRRQLDEQSQSIMVMHEHEHVRAQDTMLLLGGLILATLIPWNIMIWLQFRRLKHAVELDCDGRVLRRGVSPRRYGELLIEITARGRRRLAPAVAFAAPKPLLSRRITLMIEHTSYRHRWLAFAGIATAAVLVGIGCTMPTPPSGGDEPTFSAAESSSTELHVEDLKAQLAEAHDNLSIAERALEDDVLANATPESAIERSRRAELVRSVRLARGIYESLLRAAKDARQRVEPGLSPENRPEEEGELEFKFEFEQQRLQTPAVYIDGIRIDTEPNASGAGENNIFKLQEIDPATIEQVEVVKGNAATRLHPELRPRDVIRITTKSNPAREPGA